MGYGVMSPICSGDRQEGLIRVVPTLPEIYGKPFMGFKTPIEALKMIFEIYSRKSLDLTWLVFLEFPSNPFLGE